MTDSCDKELEAETRVGGVSIALPNQGASERGRRDRNGTYV